VHVDLPVKYLLLFKILSKIECIQHIWVKVANMKVYANMSHCICLLILSALTQNFEDNY